ncbi:ribosome maturation factor RimM [Nitrospina sp. 32_T5]|uniref:ribosome maturation factor RimM n=1 Tax=unclassified Nitrospina TaxID=2638683 RepID=UPI003F9BF131
MEWIAVGRVTKPHGLKGELKLHPFVSDTSLLKTIRHGRMEMDGGPREWVIESVRGAGIPLIIKFQHCDTPEQARELAGNTLEVPDTDFPGLAEGEYYWFQILDLRVFDEDGRFYGIVDEIIETGSNDVYVVKDGEKELLLPMIDSVVKKIDLDERTLIFHKVEGLVEDHPV